MSKLIGYVWNRIEICIAKFKPLFNTPYLYIPLLSSILGNIYQIHNYLVTNILTREVHFLNVW